MEKRVQGSKVTKKTEEIIKSHSYFAKVRTQQPNRINEAVQTFNIFERRVFLIIMNQLVKQMTPDINLFDQSLWWDVPTRLIGTNLTTNKIEHIGDSLITKIMKFSPDEDYELFSAVVFDAYRYTKRRGILQVRITDLCYPRLVNLSKGYHYYNYEMALSLRSIYSMRLYEWFSQYSTYGFWKNVSIEYLRDRLNIPDKVYTRNDNFMRCVLYEPIEEINSKTDLVVTISSYTTSGKTISSVDFTIQKKETLLTQEADSELSAELTHFKSLSQAERQIKLAQIFAQYKIDGRSFNKTSLTPALVNELFKADFLIRNNRVTVKTTPERYMNGIIVHFGKYKSK